MPQPTHDMRIIASPLEAAWSLRSLPCRLVPGLFRIFWPMLIVVNLAGHDVQHAYYFEHKVLSSYPAWRDAKALAETYFTFLVVLVLAAIVAVGCVSATFAKALTHQRFIGTMTLGTLIFIVVKFMAKVRPDATLVLNSLYAEQGWLSFLKHDGSTEAATETGSGRGDSDMALLGWCRLAVSGLSVFPFERGSGDDHPSSGELVSGEATPTELCGSLLTVASQASLATAAVLPLLVAIYLRCRRRCRRVPAAAMRLNGRDQRNGHFRFRISGNLASATARHQQPLGFCTKLLGLCIKVFGVLGAALALALGLVGLPFAAAIVVPLGLSCWLALFSIHYAWSMLLHVLLGTPRVGVNSHTLRATPRDIDPPTWGVGVVTVPVYTEPLATIESTLREATKLATPYKGKTLVVVCDDGMLAERKEVPRCTDEERQARRQLYTNLGVAWVARPAKGRRGKFKKSSNLNTGLTFADAFLKGLVRTHGAVVDGRVALDTARGTPCFQGIEIGVPASVLETLATGISRAELDAWFNLQLDADTRTPDDCDALGHFAREFHHEPKLGALQCAMKGFVDDLETATAFQKMQLHWTAGLFYEAIPLACAGGCPPPIVGHNVALRGAAMLEVAAMLEKVQGKAAFGGRHFWSELHTGEDFVMMMKIMQSSYPHVAYVTYMEGWAEGVDENVHVNWTNYKKYVNSTMEMVFNPPRLWFALPCECNRKEGEQPGVFTPLIKEYLFNTPACPWYAKVATLGYLGTHLAFGLSLPLVWLAVLWLRELRVRPYVLSSLDIYATVLIVFTVFGSPAQQVIKRRHLRHTCIGTYLAAINEEATGQRWQMRGGWPNLAALWVEMVVYGGMKLFLFGGLGVHTSFIVGAYLLERAPDYGASRLSGAAAVPRNALQAASNIICGTPAGEVVRKATKPQTCVGRLARRVVCGKPIPEEEQDEEMVVELEGGYAKEYAVLLASSFLHLLLWWAGIIPVAWEVLPLVSFHVFGLSAPLFLDETFRSNTRLWADERVDKLAMKLESWNVPIGSGQPGSEEEHGLLGTGRMQQIEQQVAALEERLQANANPNTNTNQVPAPAPVPAAAPQPGPENAPANLQRVRERVAVWRAAQQCVARAEEAVRAEDVELDV